MSHTPNPQFFKGVFSNTFHEVCINAVLMFYSLSMHSYDTLYTCKLLITVMKRINTVINYLAFFFFF